MIDATTLGGAVQHDAVNVSCISTLGGLLHLTPLDEFDPPVGTEMVVLTASQLVSTFDVVLLPALPGRFISVEYNGGDGVAGDANVTLVVGSLDGGVAIGEPALATLDGAPLAIAPGNIDGENDYPDLAIAIPDESDPTGANGTLIVLFDLEPIGPSLAYGSIRTFGVGREPRSIAIGDVDGNGADDIAVANASSDTVDVYFMNGEKPIAQTSIAVGDRPMDLALAPLGGVAGLDLVTANMDGDSLTKFGYDGNYGFVPTGTLAATGPCSVDPIDFNDDGKMDLVAGLFSASAAVAFANGGTGTFAVAQTIPVGAGPIDVLGADFNGDGATDLVTSNLVDGTVSVIKNTGVGSAPFAPSVELPVGAAGAIVGSLAVVDLGEDIGRNGDPEILVVANETSDPRSPRVLRVLRNDSISGGSSITFADAVTLSTGGNTLVVAATGPDAVGPSDLIVLNEPEGGVARGITSVLAALPVGAGPASDFNDDGHVNAIDLGILLGAWGACAGCEADIDGSGNVGPVDLGILLGNWTG
ncbi:MAG: VCBS repeat-containing protein [Phycisphaerae bacterium]|nr:VCBS repeat-containing protein [Phycisphaerae bacterium]